MRSNLATVPSALAQLKSDYAASTPSRFRRQRSGLFGSADSHYANEWNFIKVREYARDMDRNDAIIGQLLDRAVDNQIQNGYLLKPDTGDDALNAELFARWTDWATDPLQCDAAGEHIFAEMEWLTARAEYLDGDIFGLPLDEGSLQLIEADRVRTPEATKRNVVHGVLLDDRRRHTEYWFAKDNLNPYDRIYRVSDMERVNTFDAAGNRQVFHIYSPNRVSQTRGVTCLHAVFDICGMVEDTNFAALVKQQMSACVVGFFKRSDLYASDNKMGERRNDRLDDGSSATTEGISPGQILRGAKGEDFQLQSSNIPGTEFVPHMRYLLQIVGCAIGMPLVLVLLDGRESNFSGARVALDQARLGFRTRQNRRAQRFHAPVYRWKVAQWLAEDPVLRSVAQQAKIKIFRHAWKPPSWPYLQPEHDAQANKIQLENLLASPTQIAADDGRDYKDILAETIRDNGDAVEAAIVRAMAIEKKTGVKIHWRDVLNRALPAGATERDTVTDDTAVNDTGSKTPPSKGKKGAKPAPKPDNGQEEE